MSVSSSANHFKVVYLKQETWLIWQNRLEGRAGFRFFRGWSHVILNCVTLCACSPTFPPSPSSAPLYSLAFTLYSLSLRGRVVVLRVGRWEDVALGWGQPCLKSQAYLEAFILLRTNHSGQGKQVILIDQTWFWPGVSVICQSASSRPQWSVCVGDNLPKGRRWLNQKK